MKSIHSFFGISNISRKPNQNLIENTEISSTKSNLEIDEKIDSIANLVCVKENMSDKNMSDKNMSDKNISDKNMSDKNMNEGELNQQDTNLDNNLNHQLDKIESNNSKDQLKFELNCDNENKLISILNDFANLIYNENILNKNLKMVSPINQINQNELTNSKDQLEFEFELNFEIRSKLISLINRFTSILYCENFPNKNKNIIDESNELILNLSDMPLKLNTNNCIESSNNDNQSVRPIFILNTIFKNKIVNLLNLNKNYAIIYRNIIDKEKKNNLIQLNNDLISKLMKLPIELIVCQNGSNNSEEDSIDCLKDQNCIKSIIENDFKKELNRFEEYHKEIEELRSEFQKLRNNQLNFCQKIADITIGLKESNSKLYKKEVNFFYELKDFSKFSEKNGVRRSQIFSCLESDWCLKISIILEKKSLEFCLVFFGNLKFESEKKCKVDAELTILNQLPGRNNKYIKIANHIYDKKNGRIFNEDLNFLDLKEDGFIENNQLAVHLFLKADWISINKTSEKNLI